jgi:hypothetical protein
VSNVIADWVIKYEEFKAQGIQQQREAICQACPYYRQFVGTWCAKCGCNMFLKTRIMEAKCPIGKW